MSKFRDEADDYSLEYRRGTDAALAFRHPDDEDGSWDLVWLPRSQVEVEQNHGGPLMVGRIYAVMVPNWLAEEKGLI